MVRQYIGARYVPKFMGAYDNTQTYEALCVVDNGLGTSYISKVPTPAGTPLTDTTYWAIYGASSGAIINLQNQIDAINLDLADVPNQIETVRSNLQGQIDDIPLKRTVILCGDSYVQGIGGSANTIESVIEGLTNWDVRSYYAGGCGYIRENASNQKMIDVVQDAINDTSDPEIITDVVLAASVYNDSGMSADPAFTESSFVSAIRAINALVKANFPKARVTVIPALWINTTYNTTLNKVSQWTISGAKAIGANYSQYSIQWLVPYDATVQSGDNVHPSDAGYAIIGGNIASVINGTEPAIYSGVDIVPTATNDTVVITYHADHAHITGNITKESGQTFTSLFTVPQPLRKLVNFAVPYIGYGGHDLQCFLLTGSTTYFASDWLTEGTQYLIDYDVPYVKEN